MLLNSQVRQIEPKQVALDSGGRDVVLANDFVFPLIGGESPEEFLRKVGIQIVEKAITL